MKNNDRSIPDSIRDNAFFKAVAEHFPDGEWEFVQNRGEEILSSDEPIQLTAEEQVEMDEIRAAFSEDTWDEWGEDFDDSDWLYYAVCRGDIDFVRCLLDEEDVKPKNKNGVTLLHSATTYRDVRIAKSLISAKADVNARNRYGETPLHWVLDGIYELVDRNRETKKDLSDLLDLRFWIVRLLVSAGADVHAKDNCGNTPISTARAIARITGNTEVLEYLSNVEYTPTDADI